MSENYHILNPGELKRQENTLVFRPKIDDKEVTHIPINSVETILFHSSVDINTKTLQLLNQHSISVYFFNWKGKFIGSFIPEQSPKSGELLVKQVESTQHPERRAKISQQLISGSIYNMKRNLQYYNENSEFSEEIDTFENLQDRLKDNKTREDLMGIEATARQKYYQLFDEIISSFEFTRRTYNPPQNEINAAISFGNSVLYSNVSSAICKTGLTPTISYLHVSGNRRDSLSLDLADIFKPVIVDRIIIRLFNRNQLTESDFEVKTNNAMFTESGKKTFLSEYEDVLETTIEHPDLNRHVSYQTLLRLEAQKLKKSILTNEDYNSFKRWW